MTVRRLAVMGIALVLLPAAGVAGEPPRELQLPDNPLAGRVLFESRRCHQCHGIAGNGPGIGPDLGQGGFNGSFLDLGAALWNHVPGMSVAIEKTGIPWPQLTPEETVELLSFLYFIDYLGRPGVPAEGERVFRRHGCVTCHSVAGKGGKVGPDLGQLHRFASPLAVAQAIWNHGPAMLAHMQQRGMAPPTFAEGELADLSAFLRQRASQVPQQGVLLAPGNPNRGQAIFAAKGCASCHGKGARGGEGPDLARAPLPRSAEAIAGTMWNHALAMQDRMQERGIGWPSFTTEELADLVAFLYFLPFTDPPGDAARGAALFRERSCADCHTAKGGREHPGPDLAGGQAGRSATTLVAAMWTHAPLMADAILGEGRPWPELTGGQLRDLLAFLKRQPAKP
jgi:mono/diheme cytochrome c family protein